MKYPPPVAKEQAEVVEQLARISHTHLLRDDQVLAWLRQTAQFVLDV